MKYEKVLVTGGTGFVGRNLQEVMPGWRYLGSSDVKLTATKFMEYIDELGYIPDAIVHLAAVVGGIKKNMKNQIKMLAANERIDSAVLGTALVNNVPRVLSSISTCAWPEKVASYPFTEKDLFSGMPPKTNLSYGYAKRMLHVRSIVYSAEANVGAYNARQGREHAYTTFAPCNIYGPHDHFGTDSSHFIPALLDKLHRAKDGDTIELWGTGAPLRQQMYVGDLAKLIPILLEKHLDINETVIVAPQNNMSIKEIAETALKVAEKDVIIRFNGDEALNGQYRKDGSNEKLLNLIGDFEFTDLETGLRKTYEWLKQSRES